MKKHGIDWSLVPAEHNPHSRELMEYLPDEKMQTALAFLNHYGTGERAHVDVGTYVRHNDMVGQLVHTMFKVGVIREFQPDSKGNFVHTENFHPVELSQLDILDELPTVAEQNSHTVARMLLHSGNHTSV